MQRLQALKIILNYVAVTLAFLTTGSLTLGAPSGEAQICGEYSLVGKLSNDLKKSPEIETLSERGLPITIKIAPDKKRGFELLALRGKTIKATVVLRKAISTRIYEGGILGLEVAPPIGLGLITGGPKLKFLRMNQACR